MEFTAKDKRECAEREAKMRREVYARKQAGKPLTPFQERQIAPMEAIAEDYRVQEGPTKPEAKDVDLFGEKEA